MLVVMSFPVLSTERLTLSCPTPDDIPEIVAACSDAEIHRWTPLPYPYTAEHAAWFVAEVERISGDESGYDWAMRQDGELVGMIGLRRTSPGSAEIGYWLAPQARGTGLTAEAATAVIDYGFEPVGIGMALERIEWKAAVGNLASAHVAQSLGFRYEGRHRSAIVVGSGRHDAWTAGRLYTDKPAPRRWSVLR